MSNSTDNAKKSKHNHIDPVFKQLLVEMSDQLNVSLETQVEVSRPLRAAP